MDFCRWATFVSSILLVLVLLSKVVSNNLRWLLSSACGERDFMTYCEDAGDRDDGVAEDDRHDELDDVEEDDDDDDEDVGEDDGIDVDGMAAQEDLEAKDKVGDRLRSPVVARVVEEILSESFLFVNVLVVDPLAAKYSGIVGLRASSVDVTSVVEFTETSTHSSDEPIVEGRRKSNWEHLSGLHSSESPIQLPVRSLPSNSLYDAIAVA